MKSSAVSLIWLYGFPPLNLRSTGNKSSISRATAITHREPRSRLGNIYPSMKQSPPFLKVGAQENGDLLGALGGMDGDIVNQ